jgi:hypothetical protein
MAVSDILFAGPVILRISTRGYSFEIMAASNELAHFYVTLLSKASQTLYKLKTLISFTVHLALPVELGSTDRWEVAVCELSCRPFNVGTYNRLQVISAKNAVIYCDLISQQFLGNQYVRCLRTFIQRTKNFNHVFDNVHYMPVEKRRFQDIQIWILKLNCTLADFPSSDVPTKIVLQFRRVSIW